MAIFNLFVQIESHCCHFCVFLFYGMRVPFEWVPAFLCVILSFGHWFWMKQEALSRFYIALPMFMIKILTSIKACWWYCICCVVWCAHILCISSVKKNILRICLCYCILDYVGWFAHILYVSIFLIAYQEKKK